MENKLTLKTKNMRTFEAQKKHKKRQNIISAVILIAGIGGALAYYKSQSAPVADQAAKAQKAPALVKTLVLDENSGKSARLEKTAELSPGGNAADIISEYSGRVKTVNFEVGDYVREGQVLAYFDQGDNSPKITYDSAQTAYDIAQKNLGNTEDSAKKSVDLADEALKIAKLQKNQAEDSNDSDAEDLAKKNVNVAEDQKKQAKISADLQVSGARLQLEQSKAALEQARLSYEKTIIKAPISGTVYSKSLNVQDFLNSGDSVGSIAKAGNLEILVYLNADQIGRIKKGDSVGIWVNGREIGGSIASLSNIANGDNNRFEVRVTAAEADLSLVHQTAVVDFDIGLDSKNQGAFFVPLDALNIGQQKSEVFVVEDGKAKAKTVKTGKTVGTEIEILSGLSAGDEVIVENARNLQDGQDVKVG